MPNIDHKEISKILIDLHEAYINAKNDQLLVINLSNNEYGINKENIDKILINLLKLKVLHKKAKIQNNCAYLMKFNTNFLILDEIKHIYNFDLQLYMKDKDSKNGGTNIINVGGDIIASQVGHESDFRGSEFHQIEKIYPNNPARISQEESTIFQRISTFFNHQVIGGLFVAAAIAIITWLLSKI